MYIIGSFVHCPDSVARLHRTSAFAVDSHSAEAHSPYWFGKHFISTSLSETSLLFN